MVGSISRQAAVAPLVNKTLPGGIDASHRRPARALLVPNLEDQILIGPHAENRRDPVRRICFQVSLDVLACEETGVLLQIDCVANVAVQIDDSRHDPCAGQVQDFGAGRRLTDSDFWNEDVEI